MSPPLFSFQPVKLPSQRFLAMKLFWFFYLLLAVFVSKAASYPSRKECGPNLERVLDVLCNKFYYGPSKKSVLDILSPRLVQYDEYENEIPDDTAESYDFRRLKGLSSLSHSRRRRGIVEECCDNPCSYETLRLYCGK